MKYEITASIWQCSKHGIKSIETKGPLRRNKFHAATEATIAIKIIQLSYSVVVIHSCKALNELEQ